MVKFSDDYEIKDIENVWKNLKKKVESQKQTFAVSFISKMVKVYQ